MNYFEKENLFHVKEKEIGPRPRILVVEDDELCQLLIKEFLVDDNYKIDFVNNGEDGLKKIMVGNYDMILIDILIPKIDGIELAKRIRIQDNNIPLIAVTAYINPGDCINFGVSGFNQVIEKPLRIDNLRSVIRKILEYKY